ncbi:SsgA family sporulation/cell division regulator [Kitasatospora sp. McL0602]|uniref:SsgA family sporulation/cell division regulator n=1 Tax=Kitasatospora sp. McL0602 TaxID=3439530 RepID=UPI003F8CA2F0
MSRDDTRADGTTSAEIQVELFGPMPGGQVQLSALWSYDPRDPFAVHVDFRLPFDGATRWTFARDLLAAGLDVPSGDGDVALAPELGHRRVLLMLCGSGGAAVLRCEQASLHGFLNSTFAEVPGGAERCAEELDRWLKTVQPA